MSFTPSSHLTNMSQHFQLNSQLSFVPAQKLVISGVVSVVVVPKKVRINKPRKLTQSFQIPAPKDDKIIIYSRHPKVSSVYMLVVSKKSLSHALQVD